MSEPPCRPFCGQPEAGAEFADAWPVYGKIVIVIVLFLAMLDLIGFVWLVAKNAEARRCGFD